ncbi:MAG: ATP-binding protein, partial [Rhizomicrobium sp.]
MESRPHAALIHLVCGSTGAGKTTYAIALAEKLKAVRFSIDEWMAALFWMDSPHRVRLGDGEGRTLHGPDLATAAQVAACGVPCVLDLGFGQRPHRDKFRALTGHAGFSVQL